MCRKIIHLIGGFCCCWWWYTKCTELLGVPPTSIKSIIMFAQFFLPSLRGPLLTPVSPRWPCLFLFSCCIPWILRVCPQAGGVGRPRCLSFRNSAVCLHVAHTVPGCCPFMVVCRFFFFSKRASWYKIHLFLQILYSNSMPGIVLGIEDIASIQTVSPSSSSSH